MTGDRLREELATTFEAHRPHLFSVAYRMLGSVADAEDVLQDGYVRWQAAPREAIASPRAYLTTIVTRLCIDALTSARAKREAYVGPWLPEPSETIAPVDVASLSLAFLVVLEALSPLERAAFVMHDVLDEPVDAIAHVLQRDEAAVRKLVQRARAHVAARKPRFAASRDEHARLLGAFLEAIVAGDPRRVEALLADDVRAVADGGGRVTSARKEIAGRDAVARYVVGLARKANVREVTVRDVNGAPALVFLDGGRAAGVLAVETDGARVYAVYLVVNPEKLSRLTP